MQHVASAPHTLTTLIMLVELCGLFQTVNTEFSRAPISSRCIRTLMRLCGRRSSAHSDDLIGCSWLVELRPAATRPPLDFLCVGVCLRRPLQSVYIILPERVLAELRWWLLLCRLVGELSAPADWLGEIDVWDLRCWLVFIPFCKIS